MEYTALVADRDASPDEHIDLLRRAHALYPSPVNSACFMLVPQLLRMYAKWGREEYAREIEERLAEIKACCGESAWALGCLADIAFLRGDHTEERALRERSWELHQQPDSPRALMDKAIELFDAGDKSGARALLHQAAEARDAPSWVHIYLSLLAEDDDPATVARARADAVRTAAEPLELVERKFAFARDRLRHGKYADVRRRD
jgi:hypothetical protein